MYIWNQPIYLSQPLKIDKHIYHQCSYMKRIQSLSVDIYWCCL